MYMFVYTTGMVVYMRPLISQGERIIRIEIFKRPKISIWFEVNKGSIIVIEICIALTDSKMVPWPWIIKIMGRGNICGRLNFVVRFYKPLKWPNHTTHELKCACAAGMCRRKMVCVGAKWRCVTGLRPV